MTTISKQRLLCVVTGASRGLGAVIVKQLAACAADDSAFLLTATNVLALEERAKEIQQHQRIECVAFDLSTTYAVAYEEAFIDRLKTLTEDQVYDVVLLVHNAGTIGDIADDPLAPASPERWHSHLQVNLVSMIQLHSLLSKFIDENNIGRKRIVVQITSLLAQIAAPSLGMYSVSRAARDAYARSLAVELPHWRVLSYAPGPLATDMFHEIVEKSHNISTRQQFKEILDKGQTISLEKTVSTMIQLLDNDTYKSGDHVDVFDVQK